MAKKISFKELEKLDKQYNKQKKIEVNGYEVMIDEKFRPTKIQRLIIEYQEKVKYCMDNDIDIEKVDWTGYFLILLVKYFTDIEIPDEFSKQLIVLDLLLDNGFLMPIIEAMDEAEIKKISEYMEKLNENIGIVFGGVNDENIQ